MKDANNHSKQNEMVLTEYRYSEKKLGISIALVTDLHGSEYQNLLTYLRAASPDVILVAGDTLERHTEGVTKWTMADMEKWQVMPGKKSLAWRFMWIVDRLTERKGIEETRSDRGIEFLKNASKLAPIFLSVGNHEWYFLPSDYQAFRDYHITLLDNEDVLAEIKGKKLQIGGLSTRYDMEWLKEFSKKPDFKILMCHDPAYYRSLIKDTPFDTFDLVLSGHYHGGQWRVFNRGVYVPRTGLFVKNIRGQFGKLVISAGTANTTQYPRFGNPCELVLISI